MRVFTRLLLLVVLLALIASTGCAPKRIALDPERAESIATIYVEHSIPNIELEFRYDIQTGGGAMFGLIGGLVDASVNSSRRSEAETLSVPLQAAIAEVDVCERIWSAFDSTLVRADWPKTAHYYRRADRMRKERGEHLAKFVDRLQEDAYLQLDSEIFVAPGGVCVGTETEAFLYRKGSSKPIYQSKYCFLSDEIGAGIASDGYAVLAADDAALFMKILSDALAANQRMLRRDLLLENRFPASNPKGSTRYTFQGLGAPQALIVQGEVIESDDSYLLIRSSNGYLYTIGKSIAALATSSRGWQGAQ